MDANATQSSTTTETAKTEAPAAAATTTAATEAPKEILGAQAAEAKPGDAKPGEAAKAPAEIALKFPEGFKADDALIGEFKPLAQKFGLTSEGAQSLFDLHVKALQAQAEQSKAQTATERTQWIAQAQADKEFGGTNFKQNIELANQAYSKFATPELQKFLSERGLASHPEVVRHFFRLGKSENAEDKLSGTTGAAPGLSDADKEQARLRAMYPSMFPKS